MGRSTPPPNTANQDQCTARALATALATALRNLAIYPASHPRVADAAGDFVQRLAGQRGDQPAVTVHTRNGVLAVDGKTVPLEGAQLPWLVERLRDAGLRGIRFAADCTAADLVEFAVALTRARSRLGVTFLSQWRVDHERLRPLEMVFQGQYTGTAPAPDATPDAVPDAAAGSATLPVPEPVDAGPGAGRGALPGSAGPPARLQPLLARLAADAGVLDRLASIEKGCADPLFETNCEVDLLAAITEVMPADVAADPDRVVAVVAEVLGRVQAELRQTVRNGGDVEGAATLRLALSVARRFFQTEAPAQPIRHDLPSGRPEDDRIVADLGLLLAELAALPDGQVLRLPPAAHFAVDAPTMARELLGVYLHTLARSERESAAPALRPRLLAMLAKLPEDCQPLLDAHLRPDPSHTPRAELARRQLLGWLVDAGQPGLCRQRGYVDADFVRRGFPESLPLAARILGTDPAGVAMLRGGLAAVTPSLATGGAAAAVAAGVLRDPVVVRALAKVGGTLVLPLLLPVAANGAADVRLVLVEHLRSTKLPGAEAAVLGRLAPATLPAPYVEQLLLAATHRRFDDTLRAASGDLLRLHVQQGRASLPHERLLEAIAYLQFAPGPKTEALLAEIANAGRFTQFGAKARAVRLRAKEVLAAIRLGV